MPPGERHSYDSFAYRKGSAKVRLYQLEIKEDAQLPHIDDRNVARLCKIFELEGCQREDPANFVPVLISSQSLREALEQAGVNEEQLRDPRHLPVLRLPGVVRAQVLHGRHRLRAAQHHLAGDDKWWAVDVYDSEIPIDVQERIKNEFQNERALSDGYIYRRLRQDQLSATAGDSSRWLARLTPTKRRDVLQLLRKEPALVAALDALLPFPGLWYSVELGTLHRLLTLRCSDELVRYLQQVYRTWSFVMQDANIGDSALVDSMTVDRLETLHPSISSADSQLVRCMMNERQIFPYVSDGRIRGRILDRLQTLQEPIMSLHTFLEDTKLLEVTTKPLRQLLSPKSKGSLLQCFRSIHQYRVGSPLQIEVAEQDYTEFEVHAQLHYDVFYIHYLQLVLFCMRHFYGLTGTAPRRDRGYNINDLPRENCSLGFTNLARLAKALCFTSEPIINHSSVFAEEAASLRFLSEICPSNHQRFNQEQRADLARQISDSVQQNLAPNDNHANPSFTTDLVELEKVQRMGRSFCKGYHVDQKHVFLRNFYTNFQPARAEYLTTLAVKRYVFVAFFGTPNLPTLGSTINDDPRQPSFSLLTRSDAGSSGSGDFAQDRNSGIGGSLRPSYSPITQSHISSVRSHTHDHTERGDEPETDIGGGHDEYEDQPLTNDEPVAPQVTSVEENDLFTPSQYSQASEFEEQTLIEIAREAWDYGINDTITIIDCSTKLVQRPSLNESHQIFKESANSKRAFATLIDRNTIQRHNLRSLTTAVMNTSVVFLYDKNKGRVNLKRHLEDFLRATSM